MPAVTNCVRVRLQARRVGTNEATHLLTVRRQLEGCGEISRVSVHSLSNGEQALQVTFYDVRGALAAKALYGEACLLGPADGVLSVTLSKAVFQGLPETEVSGVRCTLDGRFDVDFFDTRAAERAAAAEELVPPSSPAMSAYSTCDSLESLDAHDQGTSASEDTSSEPSLEAATDATDATDASDAESPATSSAAHTPRARFDDEPMFVHCGQGSRPVVSKDSRPCYVTDLLLSRLRWEDLASQREERTSLRLRGLPPGLCEPARLRTFLASQGLSDAVSSVSTARGIGRRGLGEAIVKARSSADVQRIAKFFHGCRLGNSLPVMVSFAAERGARAPGAVAGGAAKVACSIAPPPGL